MEKIRKGNDISILWEIMRGTEEVPYDLTGKDLTLYIKSMYKTEKVTDFTTEGNVLKWTFLGKNQSHTGVYSLTLVENEGKEDMHTVDECHAFELVNCSSKVGGDAESHVQIKIVSLKSAILLNAILPDKELDTNSTNVVENGAIAREFEATNKRIDELPFIRRGIGYNSIKYGVGSIAGLYHAKIYLRGIDFKNNKVYLSTDETADIVTSNFSEVYDAKIDLSPYLNNYVFFIYHDGTLERSFVTKTKGNILYLNSLRSNRVLSNKVYTEEPIRFNGWLITPSGASAFQGGSAVSDNSHAEGDYTLALSDYSHTEGLGTMATNMAEHAEGKYNKSNEGTIHSVGIGGSTSNRKNAHEIMQDGKHYIYGIGGYDGTNPTDSEDLATAVKNLIEITYIELVNLRNTSKLTSGRFYRITDYITTTTQANTQSAGHPFDVIVLALSESELSEQAWAIQSARDTDGYFANSKLSTWQIWYCLDNDTSRFAWADTANGKGVIYRMIDEHNNDCPYDFKNIQFRGFDMSGKTYPISQISMAEYVYTFNIGFQETTAQDWSLTGKCHRNMIKPLRSGTKQSLNRNIFLGVSINSQCYHNQLDYNCYDNYFGTATYNNILGSGCYDNIFDNESQSNILKSKCYNNTFGIGFVGNLLEGNCHDNFIGEQSKSNIFQDGCRFITEGNIKGPMRSNYFSQGCHHITYGGEFAGNKFGVGCNNINIGTYCIGNEFGADCSYLDFIDDSVGSGLMLALYYSKFGTGLKHIKFWEDTGVSQDLPPTSLIKLYDVKSGIEGTSNSKVQIKLERGRNYQTTVAVDSSGNVKQFCIADIIL